MEKKGRSWIKLVVFCSTSSFLTAILLALVFASATLITAAAQAPEKPAPSDNAQSFSGIITDDHCGAKHKLADKSPGDCTRICVTQGAKYVLVDGDKIYRLQGDVVKLYHLAGGRVTVVGSLHGDTIDFTSITQ